MLEHDNTPQEGVSTPALRSKTDKKRFLGARDGWQCHYCLKPLTPIDDLLRLANERVRAWIDGGDPSIPIPDTMTLPVVDHKIPKVKNGTSHISNLVLCCERCNSQKGWRLSYEEFLAKKRQEAQAHV